MPQLTIGIATHNRADYLTQCLNSLANQTYRDFVVLVADNASVDNTGTICESFRNQFNIEYIRHSTNIGAVRNMNYVLEMATTPYFTWVGDDDLLSSNYLADLMEVTRKNRGVIAAPRVCTISLDGERVHCFDQYTAYKLEDTRKLSRSERLYRAFRYGGYPAWAWGVIYGIFSTERLKRHPLDVRLRDPGALFTRAALRDADVVPVPSAVYEKRRGGESSTASWSPWEAVLSYLLIVRLLLPADKSNLKAFLYYVTAGLAHHVAYNLTVATWVAIRILGFGPHVKKLFSSLSRSKQKTNAQ